MRVIAGSKRSIPLMAVGGKDTRPTTDRIKETLFNMISNDLCSCDFLDLYAGSGQIGIEALSRGAALAVFIEQNRNAVRILEQNLDKTGFTEQSIVYPLSVKRGLLKLSEQGRSFSVIFMDPPYRLCEEASILKEIIDNRLLKDDGYVIIEAAIDRSLDFFEASGFELIKVKPYKTNQHIFLKQHR